MKCRGENLKVLGSLLPSFCRRESDFFWSQVYFCRYAVTYDSVVVVQCELRRISSLVFVTSLGRQCQHRATSLVLSTSFIPPTSCCYPVWYCNWSFKNRQTDFCILKIPLFYLKTSYFILILCLSKMSLLSLAYWKTVVIFRFTFSPNDKCQDYIISRAPAVFCAGWAVNKQSTMEAGRFSQPV